MEVVNKEAVRFMIKKGYLFTSKGKKKKKWAGKKMI